MLALKWSDIDIENKLINVNKAVEYINNQPHLKTTKTSSGIRKVPILDNVLPYITKQPENKDMFIFGDDRIYSETMIKRRWKKYIDQVGLNITQHQLRHSYATILYKAGIEAKTAQNLLGHADVQTTLNIYTHIKEISEADYNKLNSYVKEDQ